MAKNCWPESQRPGKCSPRWWTHFENNKNEKRNIWRSCLPVWAWSWPRIPFSCHWCLFGGKTPSFSPVAPDMIWIKLIWLHRRSQDMKRKHHEEGKSNMYLRNLIWTSFIPAPCFSLLHKVEHFRTLPMKHWAGAQIFSRRISDSPTAETSVGYLKWTYHRFPEAPVSGYRNMAQTWQWSPDSGLWWLCSSATQVKEQDPSSHKDSGKRSRAAGEEGDGLQAWATDLQQLSLAPAQACTLLLLFYYSNQLLKLHLGPHIKSLSFIFHTLPLINDGNYFYQTNKLWQVNEKQNA